ncbi:carboxypeptidase-like regulatory domain-containing protein [Chondromyces crocatus]|uniref:Carboxypeptidase regulatory-like domain-containing protein n=1 Tax=Chondromyces crocatus TaxID=52 RepID=A0A0K1ESA0_CHOCO|nr:carboxypeptidase-like regulatory domain-containing protein [Chondromyces crocatus]AKT43736.1 uncharacterized protein CMC5_079710 [Chondromyces crocatus]
MTAARRRLPVALLGGVFALGGCGLVLDWSSYDDGGQGAAAAGGSGQGGDGQGGGAGGTPSCEEACPADMVCEFVEGGGAACFPPLFVPVEVRRYDGASERGSAVDTARVVIVAADDHRALSKAVERSDPALGAGIYRIQVPARRDANGKPVTKVVYAAVQADRFENQPSWVRPVEMGNLAKMPEGPFLSVKLAARSGNFDTTVRGRVNGAGVAGALVVATDHNRTEGDPGAAGAWSIVDAEGAYVLHNLPQGTFKIRVHAAGVWGREETLDVLGSGSSVGVTQDLEILTERPLFTLSGRLTTPDVDPAPDERRRVGLVPMNVFNLMAGVGPVAPGWQVQVDGQGAFTFQGVPSGYYALVAGLEPMDRLTLDPLAVSVIAVTDGDKNLGDVPLREAIRLEKPIDGELVTSGPISLTFETTEELKSAALVAFVFGPGGRPLFGSPFPVTEGGEVEAQAGGLLPYRDYSYVLQATYLNGSVERSELHRGFFRTPGQ